MSAAPKHVRLGVLPGRQPGRAGEARRNGSPKEGLYYV